MFKTRFFSALGALSILVALSPAGRVGAQEGRVVRPEYGRFDVEVVVNGYPLEAIYGRGRRYVEAREDSEYELVVRNPLGVRVAVALSVDGLNTIDARRISSWESSKWVIEPYGTIRIKGWQTSSSSARRFYFTTERDSYAAKLGRASDLGVITAVFYRENAPRRILPPPRPYYDEDGGVERRGRSEESPRDSESRAPESAKSGDSAGATSNARPRDDGYAATGIGRSTRYDVEWIHMNLERSPAAEITIRYEYRDALIRLGLLPRYYRDDEDALRRRERARGFEDRRYSPEP